MLKSASRQKLSPTGPAPGHELMGHARIEMTMRYITVNEAQLRSAIATMHGAKSWQPAGSEKSKTPQS